MTNAHARVSRFLAHLSPDRTTASAHLSPERTANSASSSSRWSNVPVQPADAILGMVAAFKLDTHPRKVNVAQGAYRTEEGKPYVLKCVRKAEKRIANSDMNKEYLGVEGNPAFLTATAEFAFGSDAACVRNKLVATQQSISGTGALRLAAEFVRRFGKSKDIFLPDPSWGNHKKLFTAAGLNCHYYGYLDSKTRTKLDFNTMKADLAALPPKSTVLLHACAHNPSGVDPTKDQWRELVSVFREKQLVPFFDSAYQGFATGDPDADAFSVRAFEKAGLAPIVCQSYAKSMGLYGERIGAVNVVCFSQAEKKAVLSQLGYAIARVMYSSCPLHGSRIATMVLTDPELRSEWMTELRAMSGRLVQMRTKLTAELRAIGAPPSAIGAPGDWSHIESQIGMFAFTGLSAELVDVLREKFHIYLTRNGRMSMAGLRAADIPYVASAIKSVLLK